MLKKAEFWTLTVMGVVALALTLINMIMFNQNRQTQIEINARAQYIQQGAQLESLYREIVKALADLAVRNDDVRLRDILTRQGITVTANPAPPAQAAPATGAGKRAN